jgi:carotenoid phi-ring synthase / carotenoid chi-ring synthase
MTTARCGGPILGSSGRQCVRRNPGIVLAGDGSRCDFPVALMECAATTGFLSANQLLHVYGVWTVPMRSRHQVTVLFHRLLIAR